MALSLRDPVNGYNPTALTVGPDGTVFIVDSYNYRVRAVRPDGTITTVAGNGTMGCDGDGGPATAAELSQPAAVALDCRGNLYIADAGRVRRVNPTGQIETVFGLNCAPTFFPDGVDGPVSQLILSGIGLRLSTDDACHVFVLDQAWQRLVRVDPDGMVRPIAGDDTCADSANGCAVQVGGPAWKTPVPNPRVFSRTDAGTIFLNGKSGQPGDNERDFIYSVSADGVLRVAAGSAPAPSDMISSPPGEGGPATQAFLGTVFGLVAKPGGGFYFTSASSPGGGIEQWWIRSVNSAGTITTITASSPGFSGDGGPARNARFDGMYALALGPDGSLFVADSGNNRIRRIHLPEPVRRPPSAQPAMAFDPPAVPYTGNGPAVPDATEALIPDEGGATVDAFAADSGRHLRTVDALTGVVLRTFAYDANGHLKSWTDTFNNTTKITSDAQGHISDIESPWGQHTKITYNSDALVETVTNQANEAYVLKYKDASGLLSLFTPPTGKTHAFDYDATGRLIKDSDPAGGFQTVTRVNDTTSVTTKLGRTTTFERKVDANATRTDKVTGPDGVSIVTTRGLDTDTVAMADGSTSKAVFAPDPQFGALSPYAASVVVTSGTHSTQLETSRASTLADLADPLSLTSASVKTKRDGLVFTSTYDRAKGTIVETTPLGRTRTTTLDANGLVVSVQPPGVAPILYGYDPQGRLQTIAQGARTYTTTYDSAGFVASSSGPGEMRSYKYDAIGRPTKNTFEDGSFLSIGYDQNGNVTSITPPSRPSHGLGYTPIDMVGTYTAPPLSTSSGKTSYTYNDDGQLTLVQRPDSTKVNFGYAPLSGRLESVALPGTEGSLAVSYEPGTGRVSSVQGPAGETVTSGYSGSLLTSVIYSGDVSGTVSWTFDSNFHLTTEASGFQSASFFYNDDHLLKQAGQLALSREANTGRVKTATIGPFLDSFDYEATYGALHSIVATRAGAPLYSETLQTDAAGRIESKIETVLGATTNTIYGYDGRGRLQDVTVNGVLVSHYEYDGNGARVSATLAGVKLIGSHDDQDRLTAYGATTYEYTPNGDLTAKKSGASTTAYLYDALGNLRSVALPNGTALTYVVDAFGRRVGKKVNGALVQGYLYAAGQRLVATQTATGQPDAFFVYGTRGNMPDYMVKGVTTYKIVTDHLGSVRLVVGIDGTVAQRLDYDEYGRVVLDTNPGFQPFGFVGGLYDSDTGLVRFGVRDYDAETGRWTTKDPSGFAGGANLYRYASGDPVNVVDVNGRNPVAFWSAVVFAFGSVFLADTMEEAVKAGVVNIASPAVGTAIGKVASLVLPQVATALGIGFGRLKCMLPGGGTLTTAERQALEHLAEEYGTEIHVVGSRAAGKGRNINTELPPGKGPGTRSDIDLKVDSEIDIRTRGAFSDALKNIGPDGLVDVRPLIGTPRPPVITITPKNN
jgi:RHS repeat-associated protein